MPSLNHSDSRSSSVTPHYQTFSTPPPKSSGRPLSGDSVPSYSSSNQHSDPNSIGNGNGNAETTVETPIPTRQMAVLAFIALCEQTAFNSIGPYLPDMASSFPEVKHENQVGMYVGAIASSFALAQFSTNFFWGWLSDRIGRKPVILLGTILTAACFLAFGFCKTLWQAIVVQSFMGLVNGNQGVVSTCLGEITDRSNQSRAFTYLPVLYGIGGVTGPILGGLLVNKGSNATNKEYPYLGPNLASAAILTFDFIITAIFLEESVENAKFIPRIRKRFHDLFTWMWQFTSSTRPTYVRSYSERGHPQLQVDRRRTRPLPRRASDSYSDNDSDSTITPLFPNRDHRRHEILNRDEVLNRDMILLLLTYLIFALCNVSFNSLYPIFAQAPTPTGRHFSPEEIGLSLAFAGVVTILFQICIFGKLRDKMGNRWSYRAGLFGFIISFVLMPFIGYKDEAARNGHVSKAYFTVAFQVCVVLLIKTVSTVGGLTSALLLITNSAPDHRVLGSLNGLAQSLAAAGRAAGPFLSGSLFTLATKVKIKGEAVAFGVFGGVALVGFMLSFGIRSPNLEADGWLNNGHDDDDDDTGKSDDGDEV